MSKEGRGFLTIAQNTKDVDYLRLAYYQAMNIKLLHPGEKYAVIVDENTFALVDKQHRRVFDYIIQFPYDENKSDSNWKLANEYQVFELTPFKETFKLESDLLFTRSINHWWNTFKLKDILLSTGCKNYRQQTATSRVYRKFFDDNELPDVYSGLMYFRYSKQAHDFFMLARKILRNWDYLKTSVLLNCREDSPSTDVLYALTAKLIGTEYCTITTMDFVNFVHMKSSINNWGVTDTPFKDMVMTEQDEHMIRIHNLNQYSPVHYNDKNYITDEMILDYERAYHNSL